MLPSPHFDASEALVDGANSIGSTDVVRISVVNLDDAAIVNAEVFLGSAIEGTMLGTTDGDGHLETHEIDVRESFTVYGRGEGYTEASVGVPAHHDVVRLVLPWGATIRGHVRTRDGSAAGKELFVMACGSGGSILDEHDIMRAIGKQTQADNCVARTDDTGAFRLSGLKPSASYNLLAAGNGFVTSRSLQRVKPSDDDVTLTVGAVYGCVIKYCEKGKTPIRTAPELMGPSPPIQIAPGRGASVLGTRTVQTMLSLAWIRGSCDLAPIERPILIVADTVADVYGPVSVAVRVSGYESTRAEVGFPRLVGALSTYEFELSPRARGFGEMDVEILGIADDDSHRPDDVLGYVQLVAETGEYMVSIARRDAPIRRISGIPFGNYRVSFSTPPGVVVGARQEVEIASEPVKFCASLQEVGSVECQILTSDGATWPGRAHVEVFPIIGGATEKLQSGIVTPINTTEFKPGPYLFKGLPAGYYNVVVTILRDRKDQKVRNGPPETEVLTDQVFVSPDYRVVSTVHVSDE